MATLLWLQGGACSGNTLSLFNAEEPTLCDLITDFGFNLLWHPSLGTVLGADLQRLLADIIAGRQPLDILIFEGTVVLGPNGSGRMHTFAGRPMKDWVQPIAGMARYVVAIGDCACWGGIPATPPNPTDSTGLQFHKTRPGGFLGRTFRSRAGAPVINLSGCPAHPDWITQILVALASGRSDDVLLDHLQRPKTFFSTFTQSGCPRTQYHHYRIGMDFGQRAGCLFYDYGCRGPMTHSSCNRILWNRQSSKTRAGMPCVGCTEPEFPHYDLAPGTVLKTQMVLSVPKDLPQGLQRTKYVALAGAAKSAAPDWVKDELSF